jgi:hypothetical protein
MICGNKITKLHKQLDPANDEGLYCKSAQMALYLRINFTPCPG